jgi:Xaa-Pro aminopeptidase
MYFDVDWTKRVDFDLIRSHRLARLQEQMKANELDGVMSFRAEHIRYSTNMRPLWWPITFTDRNCALVPGAGDPVLYVTSGDAARCRDTMYWLPQENIRPCGTMGDYGIAKSMVSNEFAPTARDLGFASGRIGVDATNLHILRELEAELPDAEFVPADHVFQAAMAIKHPEEIKCMRVSNKMSELAHQRAVDFIKPGVRECEVLGVVMDTFYSFGMEVPQCNLIVASGENTAPIHRFASDRIIHRGDLVFMDLGGCFNGYFSDVTRTIVVGKPNEEQVRIYRAVYDSIEATRQTMKPGATNTEVNEAAREAKTRHGFEGYLGVLGHGIGVSAFTPPLIGDISATGEEVFEFEPGMTFSIEPTVTVPGVPGGGGARIEDCFLVTEDGNELLSANVPYCEKLLGETTSSCSCGCP